MEQRRLQQPATPDGSFTFYTMDSDIEESGPRLAVPLQPPSPAAAAAPIPPAKARAAAAAAAAEREAGAANGSTGGAKSEPAVSSPSSN